MSETRGMEDLNDLLEEHISSKNRKFAAFGISSYDEGGATFETGDNAQTWTTVSIFADDIMDKNKAIETLKLLESDIDRLLSSDQKPKRVAFYLEDNSKTAYWAKSQRVRGNLGARDAIRQMGIVPSADDGEETRPATPQPEVEEATKRDVISIDL
ncbi:hypothetical protein F4677DRAFT_60065 [Hypoxylon crocopeplum]|nr:hypothetical protein F4677DRAFT_60065 [Hypoxylon crocopeplum]